MATASACSDHDGLDGLENNQLTLSMDVVLAADNTANQTRMVGDPGLAEFFEKPQHLYLFLAVGDPTTPGSNPVYCYQFETSQSKWTRSADSLVFKGRELQTVNWDSSIQLTSDLKCRAYMVASFDAITFNPLISCNDVNKVVSGPTTERELLDLKFYAYAGQKDFSNLSLRDVYSSPYNLSQSWTKMPNASTNRTSYYGTVTDIKVNNGKGLISINDTLYHTAAKVDFQWNAQSHTQSNVMVNALVDNAPNQGYLFRPSETVSAGTYSKVLLNGGSLPQKYNEERYIKVEAGAMQTDPWDNQFWIVAKDEFQSGDTYEFSADIRADFATVKSIDMQIHEDPGTYRHYALGYNSRVTEDKDFNCEYCGSLQGFPWYWGKEYEIPSVSYSWNQDGPMVISNSEVLDPYYALQYWLVNGIALKANDTYRLTLTCKAEGNNDAIIRFKLGDWDNGYSHNFTIPVGGDYADISFDVTPTVEKNGLFFQHGDFVGTIYWKSIKITHFVEEEIPFDQPEFDTEWQTYYSSGKIATFDGVGQSIAFNLNCYEGSNAYYFKNISLKINGVEQVINGDLTTDDCQSFKQKIDRGGINASAITTVRTTVPVERDLNNSYTARYANATEVNVGNQWSGRAYTYVLQPGDLDFTLTTKEGGSSQHTATRPNSNGKTNDIFAAWYKLDFNIKSAR